MGQTPNEADGDIRRVCAILERVAAAWPADSEEAKAVEQAAFAYTIVQQHRVLKAIYDEMRTGGDLTEEMKANLRRHGIDPDALEAEEPAN
jgi:hypothetical protein